MSSSYETFFSEWCTFALLVPLQTQLAPQARQVNPGRHFETIFSFFKQTKPHLPYLTAPRCYNVGHCVTSGQKTNPLLWLLVRIRSAQTHPTNLKYHTFLLSYIFPPKKMAPDAFSSLQACRSNCAAVLSQVDLVGSERVNDSMGFSMFFVGLGCLTGPPLAGE